MAPTPTAGRSRPLAATASQQREVSRSFLRHGERRTHVSTLREVLFRTVPYQEKSMNESLEVQASPGSLSSTNPRDTGPTASSTTESRQQPPMQSVSPARDQSQIDSFRKERQRASTRQSAHPTTTTDSGEVHLFLCHRSPA